MCGSRYYIRCELLKHIIIQHEGLMNDFFILLYYLDRFMKHIHIQHMHKRIMERM